MKNPDIQEAFADEPGRKWTDNSQEARELYQSTPEFQEYSKAHEEYVSLARLAMRARTKSDAQLFRVNEFRDKYVETPEYKAFLRTPLRGLRNFTEHPLK